MKNKIFHSTAQKFFSIHILSTETTFRDSKLKKICSYPAGCFSIVLESYLSKCMSHRFQSYLRICKSFILIKNFCQLCQIFQNPLTLGSISAALSSPVFVPPLFSGEERGLVSRTAAGNRAHFNISQGKVLRRNDLIPIFNAACAGRFESRTLNSESSYL